MFVLLLLTIGVLATATSGNRKRKIRTPMPLPPGPPRWASLVEAANYAKIPVRTLRDWVSKGWLPAYRIGPRQIQIDLNDVDALRRRIPTADVS